MIFKENNPDFTYTTVQINKNHQCPPHKDKYNKGLSWIYGLSAVQELHKIIKEQNNRISDLERKIEKLSKYSYVPGQI